MYNIEAIKAQLKLFNLREKQRKLLSEKIHTKRRRIISRQLELSDFNPSTQTRYVNPDQISCEESRYLSLELFDLVDYFSFY